MGLPAACPNCGQDLSAWPQARHCPSCGQETHLHAPTLWEFVHEFITHYVALEGALWRTLRGLAVPGRLTLEYLAGRRRQYLLPLRLYLSCSFVFFLALKLGAAPAEVDINAAREAAATAAASAASAAGSTINLADSAKVLGWAPYAMFLMQPLFAGLMKLLFLDRRRSYGEHFVFSLHLHSAWYLLLLAGLLLPEPVDGLPLLCLPVYAWLALRRVHGSLGGGRLFGLFLTSVAYGLLLVVSTVGMAWLAMGRPG
ncbi:MAG: DUF3667 domain-containing protein [Burkholderiales bacterium]|nr:DUF3667 domain-containing protein [Burkholderiales bacterium]